MTRRAARQLGGLGLGILLTSLASGCYGPPEDRVALDEAVGHREIDSVRVDVADGLAVVRRLGDEELVLWGNAPTLTIELATDDPLSGFRVEVMNVVADAELSTEPPQDITEEPVDRPTRRVFVLDVPRGTTVLTLGAPGADAVTSFRFALLSDVQRAIDTVSEVYARINEQPDVDFVLGAGDLTPNGTVEEMRAFERELGHLDRPYFATLGNHELGTSPPVFQDFFGRGTAHFRHKGAAFSLVDSASATLDAAVYRWLDDWMTASRDVPHVVAMHVPPVDPMGLRNGSFASRNEAAKLLTRMARGGVDLTLYGHIHTYYEFENAGIEAHISGGGGAIPERFDGIGRHFLVITFDPASGVFTREVVRVD